MINIEEIEILESMGCQMIDSLILYKTVIVGDAECSTFDEVMSQIKSLDRSH